MIIIVGGPRQSGLAGWTEFLATEDQDVRCRRLRRTASVPGRLRRKSTVVVCSFLNYHTFHCVHYQGRFRKGKLILTFTVRINVDVRR